MQRPGYVTVAMYMLLVGGVFGIFLVPFDLLYDPELLTQLSSGNLLAGESFCSYIPLSTPCFLLQPGLAYINKELGSSS